jgi:hypothetical protein
MPGTTTKMDVSRETDRQTGRQGEINLHDTHSMEMSLDIGWVRL